MGQISNFDAVVSLFTGRTGISVSPSRRHIFESALHRAMRLSGTTDVEQLCARIVSEDAFVEQIIRELAVGETYFFRDLKHFDFVRNHVVPEVFLRNGPRHVLRAWSAGCSTGEEPYSLAIAFEEDRIASRTQIIATDLSQRALEHARRGEYRAWSLRGDGAHLARAHMHEHNGHWLLDPRIKRRVDFRQLNLVTDAYPGRGDLDIIFCRNVLIYFEREAVATVAHKLVDALSEGGYLIMGPSDPSLLGHVALEPIIVPEGIFFRRQKVARVDVPVRVQTQPEQTDRLSEPEIQLAPLVVERVDVASEHIEPGIEAAHVAFSEGHYAKAIELVQDVEPGVEASLIHVRALANIDSRLAEHACATAVAMFPMSAELRYFHASLLVGLGRDADAEETLRRALYLDRTLAVCHALLGMILARRGDVRGARRAFRNAHRICSSLPPEQPVHLSNGEPAELMARAMARHVEGLGPVDEVAP